MADTDQKPAEISLDNIDAILKSEDPEFENSLDDLKGQQDSTDVEIESAVQVDEAMADAEAEKTADLSKQPFVKRMIAKAKAFFYQRWIFFKARLISGFWALVFFLKTKPIEYLKFGLSVMLSGLKWLGKQWSKFMELPLLKKGLLVGGVLGIAAALYIIKLNLHGSWLPDFQEEFLTSFTEVAEKVETYEPKEGMVEFSKAFPQPEEKFLFNKVVVNLKRTGSANPMGAFEFWVSVDAKETAIELSIRQKELADGVARAIEELTYRELDGQAGQKVLRTAIKNELNRSLSQGFVQDVYLKTMILKP